jgi:broad specificity phosphatase PhoE
MSAIFIRHGESIANVEHIIAGQKMFDKDTLSVKGIKQANNVNIYTKGPYKFWSSPSNRAQETARIIMNRMGHDFKLNISDLIYERNMMENEGKLNTNKIVKPYETTKQMRIRQDNFIDQLSLDYTHIIVSHGGFMKLLHPDKTFNNCELIKISLLW